jgi:hypothetical protein
MSEELQAEVAALRAEVAELRAQLGTAGIRLGPRAETPDETKRRTDRMVETITQAVKAEQPKPKRCPACSATSERLRPSDIDPLRKWLCVECAHVFPFPPPADRSKLCTTDGRSPEAARASQTNETGQHASYIVLCEEERAKGFVRPYRDRYKHVGRAVPVTDDVGIPPHTVRRSGGCGGVTTMGRSLSETYARDPTFYGATFCCGCNRHLPVAEFVWTADGQQVGS